MDWPVSKRGDCDLILIISQDNLKIAYENKYRTCIFLQQQYTNIRIYWFDCKRNSEPI